MVSLFCAPPSHESDCFIDTSSLELKELEDGPPAKKRYTEASSSVLEIYRRRMKRSNPADAIRKKRALVILVTPSLSTWH